MTDRFEACLRADLKRFERQMLLRWIIMLVVWGVLLFAALHYWPWHGR